MSKNDYIVIRNLLLIVLFLSVSMTGKSQAGLPDILLNGTIKEQMDYIQEKTRIYEDYRAIREDMFQKLKNNTLDSLKSSKKEISFLKSGISTGTSSIDSLNTRISEIGKDLEEMTKTKNSIRVLGMEVGKNAYNSVLWTIILALTVLLIGGYLTFKRNRSVTTQTRKEIDEIKKEFDAYKKASREAREKMSMAHFNELKKLRGA